MAAIFELDTIGKEPLWAQVLMASRIVRRAALSMREMLPPDELATCLEGCDLLDQVAFDGRLNDRLPAMKRAAKASGIPAAAELREALAWAVDSADAAESSGDFFAAERACTNSFNQAIAHASHVPTMTPLQVRVYLAGDFEQIRFACKEGRVGRYDGLGKYVFERLAPVYPPDVLPPRQPRTPVEEDYR